MNNQQDVEQRIRERAYQLWIENGKPEGKENDHWEQARSEIEGQSNAEGQSKSEDKPAIPPGTSFGP
jgi:hypothetical protein